jgi:phospholipase C
MRTSCEEQTCSHELRLGAAGIDTFASNMPSEPHHDGIDRRSFVVNGFTAAAGVGLAGHFAGGRLPRYLRHGLDLSQPLPSQWEALRVLGRTSMRLPHSLPHTAIPVGTDTMPEIEHVVVLMMENHSYDNFFGMLGRGRGLTPRGDGFTLGRNGLPTASNPNFDGSPQGAFHMPTTCQLDGKPSQEWAQAHIQYDNGRNDGFVVSSSGAVAMGYWDGRDLPFTYDLAGTFPVGDRWFCSVLGQTDPNRRYLIAATSMGMTDDIPLPAQDAALALSPPHGTIFNLLSDHGVSWDEYWVQYPNVIDSTEELYPAADELLQPQHGKPIADFFDAAAAGTLPSFTLVDPNFSTQSQENPQNIVVGEAFLASVVNALGASPKWQQTLLIITYDEHGGYYDHVPPPAALAPDNVTPIVEGHESKYDGFHRYGFRVPSVLVSPYAKPNYVSSVVYDHSSILAFVEHKFNLPALTYRDANANNLLDFLDLDAMASGQPTFPALPALAAAGEDATTLLCSKTGPGTIPPVDTPSVAAPTLTARSLGVSKRRRALLVAVRSASGTVDDVEVELYQGRKRLASARLAKVTGTTNEAALRVRKRAPAPGHYALVLSTAGKIVLRRAVRIR